MNRLVVLLLMSALLIPVSRAVANDDEDVLVYENCSDQSARYAHFGSDGKACVYKKITCEVFVEDKEDTTRRKQSGIKAVCKRHSNGSCPDADDCASNDDFTPENICDVVYDSPRTGDDTSDERSDGHVCKKKSNGDSDSEGDDGPKCSTTSSPVKDSVRRKAAR